MRMRKTISTPSLSSRSGRTTLPPYSSEYVAEQRPRLLKPQASSSGTLRKEFSIGEKKCCIFDNFLRVFQGIGSSGGRIKFTELQTLSHALFELVVLPQDEQCLTGCAVSTVEALIDACRVYSDGLEDPRTREMFHSYLWGGEPVIFWLIRNAQGDLGPTLMDEQRRMGLINLFLEVPMYESTREAAYKACLYKSYQWFFRYIRFKDGFRSWSTTYDHFLNSSSKTKDLSLSTATGRGFRMEWTVQDFLPRMNLVCWVDTEFMAQGRVWCIYLMRLQSGRWGLYIHTLSPSVGGGSIRGILSFAARRNAECVFETAIPLQEIIRLPISTKHPFYTDHSKLEQHVLKTANCNQDPSLLQSEFVVFTDIVYLN
ncbi:hypothetical protein M422DRAFT_260795 [Sphaerobolus stellatus SS14]|uniref:Uncharacterized protein n=1 Tax=Sphaerobolus stellatus (strain SS14) TaxID=990650 RepID=A0A0C9VGG7_SPHS4|nr:hypothetical protein M422DRAFT_260795 [Sphaerobolus stellatus SS14]